MQIEKLAVVMRRREGWEAADLGIALLRARLVSFYKVFGVGLAAVVLMAVGIELLVDTPATWSVLFLWWMKPLLDRIALAHLARAMFGQPQTVRSAVAELPQLLTRTGLAAALLWRRLSLKRSMLLPVWQLERAATLPRAARSARLNLIGQRYGETGRNLTIIALHMEAFMLLGLLVMLWMLMPPMVSALDMELIDTEKWPVGVRLAYLGTYALAIAIVEPMYVAGGFMLYLHRRTDLEGWDIELAFRRMAARLEPLAREADRAAGVADELGAGGPTGGRV